MLSREGSRRALQRPNLVRGAFSRLPGAQGFHAGRQGLREAPILSKKARGPVFDALGLSDEEDDAPAAQSHPQARARRPPEPKKVIEVASSAESQQEQSGMEEDGEPASDEERAEARRSSGSPRTREGSAHAQDYEEDDGETGGLEDEAHSGTEDFEVRLVPATLCTPQIEVLEEGGRHLR
jgi:hypothetical protein